MDKLADLVFIFFADGRVQTVVGLITADLLFGIAAALKKGEFDWKKTANFFQTNVAPYVIGYLAYFVAARLVVGELLGEYAYLVGEAAHYVIWAAIVASLANDIISHLKVLMLDAIVGRLRRGS